MAKTEKKVDKKSKVTEPKVHKKKSSASKTKDIVTTAVVRFLPVKVLRHL